MGMSIPLRKRATIWWNSLSSNKRNKIITAEYPEKKISLTKLEIDNLFILYSDDYQF